MISLVNNVPPWIKTIAILCIIIPTIIYCFKKSLKILICLILIGAIIAICSTTKTIKISFAPTNEIANETKDFTVELPVDKITSISEDTIHQIEDYLNSNEFKQIRQGSIHTLRDLKTIIEENLGINLSLKDAGEIFKNLQPSENNMNKTEDYTDCWPL